MQKCIYKYIARTTLYINYDSFSFSISIFQKIKMYTKVCETQVEL